MCVVYQYDHKQMPKLDNIVIAIINCLQTHTDLMTDCLRTGKALRLIPYSGLLCLDDIRGKAVLSPLQK